VLAIAVPYRVQRRAWEAAWMLMEAFADRLTIPQAIRMAIISERAPDRLSWVDCGDALATWNLIVEVRT